MKDKNDHDIVNRQNRFIFLDDIRKPEDAFSYTHNQLYLLNWSIVRTYNEFIKDVLNNGVGICYSFDHDLADEHYNSDLYSRERYNDQYDNFEYKTGYDCAKWLIEYCIENNLIVPKKILIHSMNPYGSLNIESLFSTYAKIHSIKIDIERYIRY